MEFIFTSLEWLYLAFGFILNVGLFSCIIFLLVGPAACLLFRIDPYDFIPRSAYIIVPTVAAVTGASYLSSTFADALYSYRYWVAALIIAPIVIAALLEFLGLLKPVQQLLQGSSDKDDK